MKVLVLGDVHLPYPDMMLMAQAYSYNKLYKADHIVCVGDMTDQKRWSDYQCDTEDPGSDEEWAKVEKAAKRLERLFPKMTILLGNHDIRYLKAAAKAAIPKQMLRTLKEAIPVKGWQWHTKDKPLQIDGVVYLHGDEDNGNVEAKAALLGQSVVQGHTHKGRLVYLSTPLNNHIWGMDVGCTADIRSRAFRYAKRNIRKSFVGYGTVTNGRPLLMGKL